MERRSVTHPNRQPVPIVRGLVNQIPDNLLLRARTVPLAGITVSPVGVVPAEALTSSSEPPVDPPDEEAERDHLGTDSAPRDRVVGCRACSGSRLGSSSSLKAVVKEVARQLVRSRRIKATIGLEIQAE